MPLLYILDVIVNVAAVVSVCVFDVVVSALINSSDTTMQFLLHNPIDALLAVEVSHKEYLLVFTSMCCGADSFSVKLSFVTVSRSGDSVAR